MKRVAWKPQLVRIVRVAAVGSWLVLIVLSLVPGDLRPHTVSSGNAEHAVAYGLAAFVTRWGFRRQESRLQILAFSTAAGLLELCQTIIPGRHAGVDNWLASTVGALAGILLARALVHRGWFARSRASLMSRLRSRLGYASSENRCSSS